MTMNEFKATLSVILPHGLIAGDFNLNLILSDHTETFINNMILSSLIPTINKPNKNNGINSNAD